MGLTHKTSDIGYKLAGERCIFLSLIMGQWRILGSWGP